MPSNFNQINDDLEALRKSLQKLNNTNNKTIVDNSKIVESIMFDRKRISPTPEEAKKEAKYIKDMENNAVSEESIDKLVRDYLNGNSNGAL